MKRSGFKAKACRQKKCKICEERFIPSNSLAIVCGVKCSIAYANREAVRQYKRERAEYREKNASRGDLTKKAQAEFNKFVRLRDHAQPCISCDKPAGGDQGRGGNWDCGHYRSRGSAPELKFEELNAHKQCKKCNQFLSGNVVDYRKRLLAKIGKDRLDWLEGDHNPKKYTHEELRGIAKHYREAHKQLKKVVEQTI